MEQAEQAAEVVHGHTPTGHNIPSMAWGDSAAGTKDYAAPLQTVAAGIRSAISPLQFMAGIDAASEQLGNRAFLHWVGELHATGRGRDTHAVAAQGSQDPGLSLPRLASLQFMPKKKKKKGEVAAEVVEALPETMPEAGAATLPQTEPGVAVTPGEKKKKKKPRVQVALNALRTGGVEVFGHYIHAEIGEPALLQTLTERITRAQDLVDKRDAALRAVEARMGELDLEGVPAIPQAAATEQGQVTEMAVVAPIKTALSLREQDLLDGCLLGDIRKVRRLLRLKTLDINVADDQGTPLCQTAYAGHVAVVRELLSMPGIDVNLAQQAGATPLYFAAQEGCVGVVKALLEEARGLNVNLGTLNGSTALCIAAQLGREEVVKLLLEVSNININASKFDGTTPLIGAVVCNFPGIVELLIKRGANVNIPFGDGTPALRMIAELDNIEMARVLLRTPDIQINQAGKDRLTALAIASRMGHKEIVELLLKEGAEPNIRDKNGTTPLHYAALYGHMAIVETLLHFEADVDADVTAVIDKCTPYDLAKLMRHQAIMDLLEALRRDKAEQAAQFERLSPCLRPAEPAPLLTTAGAGSAKAVGQALEDQPGRTSPSTVPTASLPQAAPIPAVQPDEAVSIPEIARDSGAAGGIEPAEGTTQAAAASVASSRAVPGSQPRATEIQSTLERAKNEFIQDILKKLRNDWLDPLDGIRLLEAVNTVADLDGLCRKYNQLAGIERKKLRGSSRSALYQVLAEGTQAMHPYAGPPAFVLGQKRNLDADAVESEIRQHLEQSYHRFISQAVNDMEFGRGKRTTDYPGLLHASAGISGVGSCSVFYYSNEETRVIRIVGVGHHTGRATYQLDYAVGELGSCGRMLRLS